MGTPKSNLEWVTITPCEPALPVQMAFSYGLRLTICCSGDQYTGRVERLTGRYLGPFTAGTLRTKAGLNETDLRVYLGLEARRRGAMPKHSRWVKIFPHPGSNWAWFLDEADLDKDYYLNIAGGHFPKRGAVVSDVSYTDDPAKLDWVGSYLCKNSSKPTYGWLSPEGVHHTCDDQCHVDFAYLVLKSAEEMLEVKGWIKTFSPQSVVPWIMSELAPNPEPTQAQRDWLFDHGVKIEMGA